MSGSVNLLLVNLFLKVKMCVWKLKQIRHMRIDLCSFQIFMPKQLCIY